MTDFATEVARYQAMEPAELARHIGMAEGTLAFTQARLNAMRKAQRRQATLAKGGKLPQHTQQPTAQGGNQ